MYKETNQSEYKITIKVKDGLQLIPINTITHITCDSYLSTIHLINEKQKFFVTKLLKEFENELADKGFIRVNHNAIANIRCIISFNKKNRYITFLNNEQCCVSVRKIKNIKDFFIN
jgi:two-component system LytT family response regulator